MKQQQFERVNNSLGLDESLGMHITGWGVQRIGWAVFLLFVTAALLGLFGNGLMSNQKTESAGNIVEYEKYGRFENSTTLHFLAREENGQAKLYIPQDYLQSFELEQITPEPDRQQAVGGYYEYSFLADGPVHILVSGYPKKTGTIESRVRINNSQFTLSQYIFP